MSNMTRRTILTAGTAAIGSFAGDAFRLKWPRAIFPDFSLTGKEKRLLV